MTLPPVHAEWLERWAPELRDADLRAALIGSGRFHGRVEAALAADFLSLPAENAPEEADDGHVAQILDGVDDEAVLRAGLGWCAPALATSLKPLDAFPEIAATRGRLQLLVSQRDHEAAGEVVAPRDAEEIKREGRACLAAWFRTHPRGAAARARLRLAPAQTAATSETHLIPIRAEIYEAALASLGSEAGA
ncbi:MAG: hypothetical protein AAGE90_08460 [Pseudomonadota bacterium]